MKTRAFVALASTLLIAACRKTATTAPPPPGVQVTDVVHKDVPIYQEWTGSLDGFVNAEIHPQVQGYIVKQVYKEGSYVQAGDVLFEIDARQFRALSVQSKGNLDKSVAALDKARLDVARDRQLLASAVGNLLSNAFKFTRSRSHVSLRTAIESGQVRIEVEDECGGLPAGKAEELFRPFDRRGSDRSGLGLGLAISQQGVAASGGRIEVQDLPGKGCVFSIVVPLATA